MRRFPVSKPRTGFMSLDFIDGFGLRNTSFELCQRMENSERLEAVAIIHIVGGDVIRALYCKVFTDRQQEAIVRMARIYMTRQQPQVFGTRFTSTDCWK